MAKSKAKVSKDAFKNAEKKPFQVGDLCKTTAEINGCFPGMTVEITAVEFDGATFRCKFVNGPSAGKAARIAAPHLAGIVSPSADVTKGRDRSKSKFAK